ncbi:MAG: hydroxyacid dehydrogenase [Alphaproteobacteria bacterium]|nr:hydroxyacid dehydrogenase [Alphaproteobacteria bacterium]
MADIVITEFMNIESVDALKAEFDTRYDPNLVDQPDALAKLLPGCRAIIVRNRTQVRPSLLAQAPKLLVVGRLGVGLDNIDMKACADRKVVVVPATGANDLAVAEFVIGGMLALLKCAYTATESVVRGEWPRTRIVGREAAARTLGIVGFGAIGRQIAPRAKAFGMTVIAYDPYLKVGDPVWSAQGVGQATLDELIGAADVITLHTPLTPETRHLMNAARIARMRRGAILINAARGGVVDEAAVIAALRSGHLGGALLDTFEKEPVTKDNPFAGVPNLILTPHLAGLTEEASLRTGILISGRVREVLLKAGRP